MIRTLRDLPKKVLMSLAVIGGALAIFALSVPLLGGARDDALAQNARLKGEVARVNTAITQSKADQDYIKEHAARYDELLKSDRLVPHTRRVAVLELENKARAFGLTGMSYSVDAAAGTNALQSAASQPTSGAYVLSIQDIKLAVKAPLDGSIYRFVDGLTASFPGAAVVREATLARGLTPRDGVDGIIVLSWRTAQAQEKK